MRDRKNDTQVIYVRHGKTDYPHGRLYCDDREDPTLNNLGLQQAHSAAKLLQHHNVDVIYTSPSKRTMMTAEAISDLMGVTIKSDPAFKERSMGVWDGMTLDAIEKRYPDEFQLWKSDPVGFVPQGGEALGDLLCRSRDAVAAIIKHHPGKTIVIVAHVGPIRVLLCDALQMPLAGFRQFTIDYGSLTRMDYGQKQNNFIYMNCIR